MMPKWISDHNSLSEFSTQRATQHIKMIAEKPHFVGSKNHEVVADYIKEELQKLGLETQMQEGITLSDWGNLVKSKNIMARIKGSDNGKALLLLSHYDSAPHSSSLGASDDASGVATILEGVRAFLHAKTAHKNDIVILFSDAEELDLNGAALFVTQSQWAKSIGLALNFEARGTSGPSYMLMEVNHGNSKLVKSFAKANPKYPVSNSLMYSIYKMLPNDTDLTVFRIQGKIQGFNFAFIDGRFNYHSAQDDYVHIDPATIAHQGTYLMPLLLYFSNADLQQMEAADDFVYFSTPFYFVNYPYNWVLPMWIVALLLFFFLVFIGIGKRVLVVKEIAKSFVLFLGALIVAGGLAFWGWKWILFIYPQYNDLIKGFTYNGHWYIAAFVALSLAIAFLVYIRIKTENLVVNYTIAPLFFWICINFALVFYLPGAGFFIIPVFFGLLMLAYYVITQRTSLFLNSFLAIPSLMIVAPFIVMFPIGLGLKTLAGSAILTVSLFGLLLPVFGLFAKKGNWAFLMLLLSAGFFAMAHYISSYKKEQAKPNSLLYVYNADKNKAVWTSYDTNLDEWTSNYFGENPKHSVTLNALQLFSKYHSAFTYEAPAPLKNLAKPAITFLMDSTGGTQRYFRIKISPNRTVNRYDVFASEKMIFHNLKANRAIAVGQKGSVFRRSGKRILSYYVVDQEPLELQFSIAKESVFDMDVLESSFDLLHNSLFSIVPRKNWMMPAPFVLNDAVLIYQKLKPTLAVTKLKRQPLITTSAVIKDSLNLAIDSLKLPK
ncbi:MAG: M28 family peptidase [Burkholderiales bacterium]|nr:M28 family peptidase [Flavobacterium sp.]